ncbi:MAG: hypothetical protein JWR39_509, partial [Devosia sp.]|nr:hypothetical protein [Devosia sp.]
MHMKSLALLPVVIALGASAASAADLIIPTVPQPIYEAAPAGFDWSGFYVGVQGGAQFAGETNG